jgi:hypothetical protein
MTISCHGAFVSYFLRESLVHVIEVWILRVEQEPLDFNGGNLLNQCFEASPNSKKKNVYNPRPKRL